MLSDLQIQYIGWACTLVGGFLCGLLTFWLLRPKPKRMQFQVADLPKPIPCSSAVGSKPPAPWVTREEFEHLRDQLTELRDRYDENIGDVSDRLACLEGAPEPLAPGVRVWKNHDGWLFLLSSDGTDWVMWPDGEWHKTRNQRKAGDYEMADSIYTELHGPERDEVVRDWMARNR